MSATVTRPAVRTALRSHAGLVRDNNEDAVVVDADLGLVVLADGMGGYNAGEVASAIAVETIHERVRRSWGTRSDPALRTGPLHEHGMLRDAVVDAHHAIRAHALSEPQQCAGMGTTVVACLIRPGHVLVAHVGDSRLYRLRGQALERLTLDHSLLEELVARGHYSREEAELRVRKNIVTRALGVDPLVEVDVADHGLEPGDLLLLCSDGLSDMVTDPVIERVMVESRAVLEDCADRLVALALDAGGRDNVSVALAQLESTQRQDGLMDRIKRLFGPEDPSAE